MMEQPKSTEVDAYIFIKENLRALGWDTRNPMRSPKGEVFTQNECLHHDEIKACLGHLKPENVVKLSETSFWVIEAKRSHKQLEQALTEAKQYANRFNKGSSISAIIISGVAGNEGDGYLVKSRFHKNGKYVPITINGKEISSLISKEVATVLLTTNNPAIEDVPVDEKLFLNKAEKINQILHLGAINKNYRARVMAALLLALIDEVPPNIDAPPSVLIDEINSRAKRVLKREDKGEFYNFISISLPPTEDNHVKFKRALVSTIQELNNLNIRSAMNSGTDVLGKFYEVFLKYGNGAKEIGIVLTPRHITKWAVEAINVSIHDIVYDPTCGTGGFLVAAFDHIKKQANAKQIGQFKKYNLFGVEQEPEVVALAIVNMIFRGDGKNNIVEGNCTQKNLAKKTIDGYPTAAYSNSKGPGAVSKVLMNPPFALKSSDDKEYRFVQHALDQMEDGGILFSVLPVSVMFESGQEKVWRESLLLKENTLLSVVTFPAELFYPIGVHTIGAFIKKGLPHPKDQNVFWIRITRDGFVKKKGKRLPNSKEPNEFNTILPYLKAFIVDQHFEVQGVPQFYKLAPIDFSDPLLELVPEAYIDSAPISNHDLQAGMEKLVRENAALIIRYAKEDIYGDSFGSI
jgi:type I restriction enzyme M protein